MVTIGDLLDARGQAWKLTLIAGANGLGNAVGIPRIQKPGLALAGYLPQIHPERIQVIGRTELGYLATLAPDAAKRAVERVLAERVAGVVVTNGATPPAYFRDAADQNAVPLVVTALKSSELIRNVTAWLEDRLAPHTLIHGVLVEVFGLGVLLLGKSGIGKSEAALDLVARGHRLVADDVVEARAVGSGQVIGSGAELIRHHMEIRGLGIINVQDLFGILATLREKPIQLVAEMIEWSLEDHADRLGLEDETHEILGVTLPKVRIPIRPGRSVATIIEVAARNSVLKRLGRHSAREVAARLDGEIARRQRRQGFTEELLRAAETETPSAPPVAKGPRCTS
jgi:HPr kinase/phosphorylase